MFYRLPGWLAIGPAVLCVWQNPLLGAVPRIDSVNPNAARIGAVIGIQGTNFSAVAEGNIVFFGGVRGQVESATAMSLQVQVPAGAAYAPVMVTVGGFTGYAPAPFTPLFQAAGPLDTTAFASQIPLPVLSSPTKITTADLDGDGRLEIVCVDYNENKLSVYRNQGSPGQIEPDSFAPRVDFTTPSSPADLVIRDLDGDGRLDVVVANDYGSNISVYRNLAAPGSFTTESLAPRVDFGAGTHPVGVAAADFDSDGKIDLVVANAVNGPGSTISVYRNTSSPGVIDSQSFTQRVDFASGTYSWKVTAGDLDGDGKPEVAVANWNGDAIAVFRNTSSSNVLDSSSFASPIEYATAGSRNFEVEMGDLNGDGKPELVVARDGGVSIYLNQSQLGGFTQSSFLRSDLSLPGNASEVDLSDLNGDGRPDIVVGIEFDPTLSFFQNLSVSGNLAWGMRNSFPAAGSILTVGDLNGDSQPDLISCHTGQLSVNENLIPTQPNWLTPEAAYSFIGNAHDESGHNHDGTVLGATLTRDRFGGENRAYTFDGLDDRIDFPQLGLTGDVSFSLWFRLAPGQGANPLLLLGQSGAVGERWLLGAATNGLTWEDQRGSAEGTNQFTIPLPLEAQVWYHLVAMSSDSFDPESKIKLYLNLALVGAMGSRAFAELSAGYQTGRLVDGGTFAAGQVDDIRIYPYLLSEADVGSLFMENTGGPICPAILTHPMDKEIVPGEEAVFMAAAEGQYLNYQWLKNGNPLLGGTQPTLVITQVSLLSTGLYAMVAYNYCGSVTSNPARLTLFLDSDEDGLPDSYEQGLSRYQIVTGSVTWAQARLDAEARGGHLATITSQAEYDLIQSLLNVPRMTLLGGTDEGTEGEWQWITGEPWVYTRWNTGEPNGGTNENVLQVADQPGGFWNDTASGSILPYYLLEFGFYSDANNPDTDLDGLSDGDEVNLYGTFPNFADSDLDGLTDSDEIMTYATDPLRPDSDGDGLTDGQEVNTYHSDPLRKDSDGDNLDDRIEVLTYGTDPTKSDTDGDGFDDYTEIYSGKDPLDADDKPDVRITAYHALEVEFPSQLGAVYQVQVSGDLAVWMNLGDPIEGTGGLVRQLFSIRGKGKGYYRVELVSPPPP